MKKLITMAVSLILMAVLAVSASASGQIGTEEINFDVDRCVDIAKDFIEDFYTAAYMGGEFDSDITIADEDFATIIQAKLQNKYAPRIITPCKSIAVTCKDVTTILDGNHLYIEIPIECVYVLTVDKKPFSFALVEYLLFNKVDNQFVLENWCSSDWSSFDMNLYGLELSDVYTMNDYIEWTKIPLDYSLYVEDAVQFSDNRVEFFYSKIESNIAESDDINTEIHSDIIIQVPHYQYGIYNMSDYFYPIITDTGWSFQRNEMASWAEDNYNKVSPIASNFSPITYTRFELSGGYDCTNFASHALLAGGAEIYDTDYEDSGWWCRNNGLHSVSWSLVQGFYDFLVENAEGSGLGPYAIGAQYVAENSFNIGDIIQVRYVRIDGSSDNVWDHSLVITGYSYVPGYVDRIPRMVSRTDNLRNSNDLFTDYVINQYENAGRSNEYRIIRLEGYRTE